MFLAVSLLPWSIHVNLLGERLFICRSLNGADTKDSSHEREDSTYEFNSMSVQAVFKFMQWFQCYGHAGENADHSKETHWHVLWKTTSFLLYTIYWQSCMSSGALRLCIAGHASKYYAPKLSETHGSPWRPVNGWWEYTRLNGHQWAWLAIPRTAILLYITIYYYVTHYLYY